MSLVSDLLAYTLFPRATPTCNIRIASVLCFQTSDINERCGRLDVDYIKKLAVAIRNAEACARENWVLDERGILVKGHKEKLYTQCVAIYVNHPENLSFFSMYGKFGFGFRALVDLPPDTPKARRLPKWYRAQMKEMLQPMVFVTRYPQAYGQKPP